jgi:hypothetical protein
MQPNICAGIASRPFKLHAVASLLALFMRCMLSEKEHGRFGSWLCDVSGFIKHRERAI